MADIEVTIPGELIQDLFTSDRGMELLVEEVLNQVMEAEMTEFLQADTYERTDQRRGYREGLRERDMS
jgi:transposase-like protein